MPTISTDDKNFNKDVSSSSHAVIVDFGLNGVVLVNKLVLYWRNFRRKRKR